MCWGSFWTESSNPDKCPRDHFFSRSIRPNNGWTEQIRFPWHGTNADRAATNTQRHCRHQSQARHTARKAQRDWPTVSSHQQSATKGSATTSIKASHCNKLGGQRHSNRSQQSSRRSTQQTLSKHGMLNRHASTTTLKTKQGIAPISIVEFFSKDARNEFLDMLRKDMLVCHGQIAVGRAQIPKYQREADQPLRCAIAVFSQCDGTRARYKPTWELSALWHSGEWVLIAEPNPKDRTDITLYIQQSKKELSATHFPEAWAQWGGQRTTNRRTDGYRPQDHFRINIQDMTPDKQTEYDEKYQTLHDTRKQNTGSNMEVEENSVRARQTKGSSKGQ